MEFGALHHVFLRDNIILKKKIFAFSVARQLKTFDLPDLFTRFYPYLWSIPNTSECLKMNIALSGDKEFIRKLTEITLSGIGDETFGGKELSRESGLSISTLNRRLQSISKKTVNQFIREIRLHKAMELLRNESMTASEVAFKVGFGSSAYFNTCFSDYFGYPPGEVKRRILTESEETGDVAVSESAGHHEIQASVELQQIRRKIRQDRILIYGGAVVLFLFILVFLYLNNFFNIFHSDKSTEYKNLDKSIAVLPFINDSPDSSNVYFINGVTEAILGNLSTISDVRVVSRNTVEQYRNNTTKTMLQISRELGVSYIVEGSGQKIGDQIMLSIQLIEGHSDKHLISEQYKRKLEDIFDLQSEIALDIASKIKAKITPEEKEKIEKSTTTSLAAWEMYSRGLELQNIAELEDNTAFYRDAEVYFTRAIQLDPKFPDPYVQIGWIRLEAGKLDSAAFFSDTALKLDDKNAKAYALKGRIFQYKGFEKEAEEAFKLALKITPNYSSPYSFLGELYFTRGDCTRAIEYQLKASQMENNPFQERNNLISLWTSLYSLGFYEESKKYADKLFNLTSDSSFYYWGQISADLDNGKYESALESSLKIYANDTNYVSNIWQLGYTHLYLKNFKESLRLLNRYTEILKHQGRKIEPDYLFGWVYLENGYTKEAFYHLEGSKKAMFKIIEQNQPAESCAAYLSLTKIYSVLNEKTKAMESLRKAKELMKFTVFRIKDFKNCTMLDNIRNEPEFDAFIKEGEAKYQVEHKKVKALLKEKGISSDLP